MSNPNLSSKEQLKKIIEMQAEADGAKSLEPLISDLTPGSEGVTSTLRGVADASLPTYNTLMQNAALNEIARFRASNKELKTLKDPVTGNIQIERVYFKYEAEFNKSINFSDGLNKLDITIRQKLDKTGQDDIFISMDEYMKMNNLSNRESAAKKLRSELITYGGSVIFDSDYYKTNEKGKKKWTTDTFVFYRLSKWSISGRGNTRGAYIAVNPEYANLVRNTLPMYFPEELKSIDSNSYPNALSMGTKMLELSRANRGDRDIVSVKVLLDIAYNLPSYDEVMESNRATGSRIVEPFLRDLHALSKQDNGIGIIDGEFTHAKGKPLSEDELAKVYEDLDYNFMITLYYKYTIIGQPSYKYIDQKRQENIKKAKKLKANNKNKKKDVKPTA